MVFKKYAVEDNCWARLASSIDANTTRIRIKNAHNLPQSWERIATLAKKQGDEILKMEKVLVLRREIDLLIVQRGFQSTAQDWEENDVINLYITAEVIRDLQNAIPDDAGLVHKSGDEEIGGNKRFTNDISIGGTVRATSLNTKQDWTTNWLNFWKEWELNRIDSYNDKNGFQPLAIRASQLTVNDQDWVGEWQTYTPTITTGGGNVGEFRIRNGRYKVVGKTVFCAIYLDFKRWEATGTIDVSLPTNSKNHTETPVPVIVGGHGMLYKDTKAKWAIKEGENLRILKGIVNGVSIQELSPHTESNLVICGEFMYEMK